MHSKLIHVFVYLVPVLCFTTLGEISTRNVFVTYLGFCLGLLCHTSVLSRRVVNLKFFFFGKSRAC
jgi:hypothetical protein